MATTLTIIEAQTLSSAQTSVTFGAGGTVPQTFDNLKILATTRMAQNSGAWYDFIVGFNGVTTNQWGRAIYGTGTGIGTISESGGSNSNAITGRTSNDATTAGVFGTAEILIPNYKTSNFKHVALEYVGENGAASSILGIGAGVWQSSAAITSITLTGLSGSSFMAGSTFYLYGIKNS